MTRHSRRRFLQGTASVIPLSLWLPRLAQGQGLGIRYELSTPQGQANLKKYATAVGILRKTPAGNPQSWNFQWYTHGTPSNKTTLINTTYPGCNPSAWCNLAKAAWSTCQPHYQPAQENFFVPWHRMYVYYLEAICRAVLKDDTFTLPYWDYTKSAVLPKAFRLPKDPTFAPLYNKNRGMGISNKPVNDGDPIDTTANLITLMNEALCEANYQIQNPAQGFNANLDWNLHGTVHGDIGGDMGAVPTAANDPIFWMHHCNIDRLWASWNNNGGANPNDPGFLSQTFTFADGAGNSVSPAIKGFLTTKALNYGYDKLVPKPKTCLTGPQITNLTAADPAQAVTDRGPGPVTLTQQPVRVALQPAAGGAAAADATARVKALPDVARLSVLIRNIHSDVHPGTIYGVFLNLPQNPSPQDLLSHRIGQISFFDSVSHEDHKPSEQKFYRFDITAAAKSLAAKNALGDALSVTIIPRGQANAEAKPVLGEIVVIRH